MAPNVVITDSRLVLPTAATLTLTTGTPTVSAASSATVSPTPAMLTLIPAVPNVVAGGVGGSRGKTGRRASRVSQMVPVTLDIMAVVQAPSVTIFGTVNDDEVVLELLAGLL
jgi:hypothetical protein